MEKEKNLRRYYFTFGSNKIFPYGPDDYVEVKVMNCKEACEKYMEFYTYPFKPDHKILNCQWIYEQEEWPKLYEEHYKGRKPVETIE